MKWAFTIFMTVAFQALLFGQPIQASADRMKERIEALSQFGANPDGGVDRVAYSDADMAGRK
ncbi:MAG TPA: hypothetical protein PKW06_05710, partial [Cyclobacteriaceae bacterium]|nr:hypothetical protein [Cyclobacteriaceae bacterium]